MIIPILSLNIVDINFKEPSESYLETVFGNLFMIFALKLFVNPPHFILLFC